MVFSAFSTALEALNIKASEHLWKVELQVLKAGSRSPQNLRPSPSQAAAETMRWGRLKRNVPAQFANARTLMYKRTGMFQIRIMPF